MTENIYKEKYTELLLEMTVGTLRTLDYLSQTDNTLAVPELKIALTNLINLKEAYHNNPKELMKALYYASLSVGKLKERFTSNHITSYGVQLALVSDNIREIEIAFTRDTDDLTTKILEWANNRGLLNPDNKYPQVVKLSEEVGELSRAVLHNDEAKIEDALGDIQVALIILGKVLGSPTETALETAYAVIKHRQGITKDGIFLKEGE